MDYTSVYIPDTQYPHMNPATGWYIIERASDSFELKPCPHPDAVLRTVTLKTVPPLNEGDWLRTGFNHRQVGGHFIRDQLAWVLLVPNLLALVDGCNTPIVLRRELGWPKITIYDSHIE